MDTKERKNTFSRRRFLAGGAATGGFLLLAACGGAGTGEAMPKEEMKEAEAPKEEAKQPEMEKITLVFRDWRAVGDTPTTWDQWFIWASDTFREMNPQVENIEYTRVPFGENVAKLTTEAAARVVPDVMHSSIIWARDLWDNGLLTDLSAHTATAPDIAPDAFMPSANPYRIAQGKVFGISFWGPDSYVMVINQDHFIEAGLDPQGADLATWDGLTAASEKLAKKNAAGKLERLGFTYHIPGLPEFAAWTYANGGDMHNEELTEAVFDSAKALEVADHRAKQHVKYRDVIDDFPSGREILAQGRGSGIHWGTWAAYYIRDEFQEGFKFWFVPPPQGPSQDGDASGATWINMIVVPDGTAHADMAFEMNRFICGLEAQVQKLLMVNQVSPRLDFYNSAEWASAVEDFPVIAVTPEVGAKGKNYPFYRRWTASNPHFKIVQDAMSGESELDLRGALAESARLITQELEA
ncbi:MAG: substrate-binding domain-containing protein [Chloroflexota bacterium]|nr:substrate-binding domain-containing protein [Chloroflexota bacterium]MDE2929812.1 substrate-binding domain-containing protein [Chloroflexota bacterium]